MKLQKRFIGAALAMFMALSPMRAFAAEAAADVPHTWAARDIFLAEAYGLAIPGMSVRYTLEIPYTDFAFLHNAFCERLAVEDELTAPPGGIVTRRYVLEELYDAISLAAGKNRADVSALEYFAGNELINGRADGSYALDSPCTAQEAIVFAVRAYTAISRWLDCGGKGFLWKVSDGDNAIYLLGSVHSAVYETYPLSREIMDAYADSSLLVLEIDMQTVDELALTALILEKAFYTDGTVLEDVLSAEAFSALTALAEGNGYSREIVNIMKPWYAQVLLTALPSDRAFTAGIDSFFNMLAVMDEKYIMQLESAEQQLTILASMSEEAQVYLLENELAARAKLSKEENDALSAEAVDGILAAWTLGDEDMMDAALGLRDITDEVMLEYFHKFNMERNQKMLPQLAVLLDDFDGNAMVIVGTLHMLYDVGLVQGLASMGYTVERIR